MAFKVPTHKELYDQFIANFESNLNQTVPGNSKSFLKVESAIEASLLTGLYKFAAERALQALALTATDGDLDKIGSNYGLTRKNAESAQFTISLPATDGTIIPITVDFVGDSAGRQKNGPNQKLIDRGLGLGYF